MQQTRRLLIGLLVLASASCARRDWVSDLLVLTDVTGTWEGSVTHSTAVTFSTDMMMTLQQSGPKVTGELWWTAHMLTQAGSSQGHERVEGVVTGEVLSFSRGISVELTVDGDEMTGRFFDNRFAKSPYRCGPCYLHFRRKSSRVPSLSEPPARQGP